MNKQTDIEFNLLPFLHLFDIFPIAGEDDGGCGGAAAFSPKQKPKFKLVPVADCGGFNQ